MKKRMIAGLLAAACLMVMCSCGLSLDSKKRDVDQQTTTAHAEKQKKETKDSQTSAEKEESEEWLLQDDADCLTEDEKEVLNDRLLKTAESIDMHVFVYLSGTRVSREDTRNTAADLYLNRYDADSDGILYYMDLSGNGDTSYSPYDYIYTRGMAQFYYTNSKDNNRIDAIFNAIDPYLPRGAEQPYEAVTQFCEELKNYYRAGIPDGYYVYEKSTDKYQWVQDGKIVEDDQPPEW